MALGRLEGEKARSELWAFLVKVNTGAMGLGGHGRGAGVGGGPIGVGAQDRMGVSSSVSSTVVYSTTDWYNLSWALAQTFLKWVQL